MGTISGLPNKQHDGDCAKPEDDHSDRVARANQNTLTRYSDIIQNRRFAG
jgi:hypothetical protein